VSPAVFSLIQVCAFLPAIIQILPRVTNMRVEKPKKPIILTFSLVGALYVVYGFIAFFAPSNPGLFLPLMLTVYFLLFCLFNLGSIMYIEYTARLFPPDVFGRVLGIKGAFMSVGSIAGGLILGTVMNRLAFPGNFAVVYMIGGALMLASSLFVIFTVNATDHIPAPLANKNLREYMTRIKSLFTDRCVKLFVILMILLFAVSTPQVFFMDFLNDQLGLSVNPATATMVVFVSQIIMTVIIGTALDKLGSTKTVAVYLIVITAALGVLLVPFALSFVVVFAAFGNYFYFITMSRAKIVNSVVTPRDRIDAVIMVNVLGSLINVMLSVLYGLLAEMTGTYVPVFIISGGVAVAAAVICVMLGREIRKREQLIVR